MDDKQDDRIQPAVSMSGSEVLDEINAISELIHKRSDGIDQAEMDRQYTIQLIAVGAIFFNWINSNPEESRAEQEGLARYIASKIGPKEE